ncbi:MAG: Rpn family recombination-promoting nuclease/putative transposase [Bacteroidota bacterium]
MQFADITNDIAFRKIFGNEQKTAPLISFLNAALELEGDHRIAGVSIDNPYYFPRIAGEKAIVLDVRATDQSGNKFVVEMQVADKAGFDKRVQYYISRDYSMQIDKGEDYTVLRPAYFIGILDFPFGTDNDYHTRHLIMNRATREHLLKDIQFSFIELPKFNKKIHELDTAIDKWTYFIKNSENLHVIPDFANEDEGLKMAFLEADKYQWTKEEIIAYDNISIREQDERGEKELVAQKAEKKGKTEVAKNLKAMGLSNLDIKRATGLSNEEIDNLYNVCCPPPGSIIQARSPSKKRWYVR